MFTRERIQRLEQEARNKRSVSRRPQSREDLSIEEELIRREMTNRDTKTLKSAAVVQLQQTIGNRAVSRLVKAKTQSAATIQRNPITNKLTNFIQNSAPGQAIHILSQHILSVINAINGGQWQTASDLLYDSKVAKSVKHNIGIKSIIIHATGKTQDQIDAEVNNGLGKGMYYTGKLDLPQVVVATNNDIFNGRTPENDAHLAMQVLPVLLEEWIHMFQHTIQGHLSQATTDFSQTDEALANRAWNMNEVDIYAIYKDLGWNSVLEAFKARYVERQRFDAYTQIAALATRNGRTGKNVRGWG